MKKLNLRELQEEELKILKSTVKFINDNKLNYYLAYGTLLGAIRHKGFIPWDDDIDIYMTRPDYDKLLEISKKHKISSNLEIIDYTLKNSRLPFAKVINKQIEINSISKEDRNLWIDIFPIDGLPDTEEETVKHYKKMRFHMGLIYLKTNSFKDIMKENKSIVNRVIKVCFKPIVMIIPMKYSSKKIIKLAKKYDYKNSKYVGGFIWGDGPQERILKKEIYSCKVDFEGEKFNAFKEYDKYLKNIYGDYMKIPDVKDQKTHHIDAYLMDDKIDEN